MTSQHACGLLYTTIVCVCLPYVCDCCQDIAHYCSECGNGVAIQQYVDCIGAEGQPPTVLLPPRPKVVRTQHTGPPTVALPKKSKTRPQEMETRHLQEMESGQPQEVEDRQLQEIESPEQPQMRKSGEAQDIQHRPKRPSSI